MKTFFRPSIFNRFTENMKSSGCLVSVFLLSVFSFSAAAKNPDYPVGYSTSASAITAERMEYARNVGIEYIEIGGLENICDTVKMTDKQIENMLKELKKTVNEAGIKIWSIHMPFSKDIDLSAGNEEKRNEVVAFHKKILSYAKGLKPEIILFHPSFYLGLNERDYRKSQMLKSAQELLPAVKAIKADMVIENMLGYDLLRDENRERPLCRTVDEMVEIMNRLPKEIGVAVDMNHIKHPEKLIEAFGKRVKTLHVNDGDGVNECHYLPCSGEGMNNWPAIMRALDDAGYKGVFLFESKYKDVNELSECYRQLRNNYSNN